MTVCFIGGDARALFCARRFEEGGATVHTLGVAGAASCPLSYLSLADACILPLPITRDGVRPTAKEALPTFFEIFTHARGDTLFLGGMIPDSVLAEAQAAGVQLLDYYRDETLLCENAYATAEAAVGLAATELPVTLRGTRVAIVGSGRIARALCEILIPIGARVDVWARNPVSLAALAARGAEPHLFGGAVPLQIAGDARAVFSTVPERVLDATALSALAPKTPIYDLGGGGVCSEAEKKRGLFAPDCRALPGRYSPESAADSLFRALLRLLRREGVMAV